VTVYCSYDVSSCPSTGFLDRHIYGSEWRFSLQFIVSTTSTHHADFLGYPVSGTLERIHYPNRHCVINSKDRRREFSQFQKMVSGLEGARAAMARFNQQPLIHREPSIRQCLAVACQSLNSRPIAIARGSQGSGHMCNPAMSKPDQVLSGDATDG
jgi:hypothetical protein